MYDSDPKLKEVKAHKNAFAPRLSKSNPPIQKKAKDIKTPIKNAITFFISPPHFVAATLGKIV
jgi:hypothetical protein